MYRNNVYFNAVRVFGNDKENLRTIHKDTKKEVLRINVEENGDTGDEEGEGEDKGESHFDIGRISWKIMSKMIMLIYQSEYSSNFKLLCPHIS